MSFLAYSALAGSWRLCTVRSVRMNQTCTLSPTVLGPFDVEERSLLAGTGPPGPGSTIEQVTVSRLDCTANCMETGVWCCFRS